MTNFEPGVRPISVQAVVVGLRRRKHVGDLSGLMESIGEHGVIHPILVRNGTELVAGLRRLEACRKLGFPTIPARDVTDCSDDELRAIELDENTERRDLDPLEKSEERLAQIDRAVAKARKELRSAKERKIGRPNTPGSTRDVARRTGMSLGEQNRIRRHVELGERFQFLRKPEAEWRRALAIRAGDRMAQLPAVEHDYVDQLLTASGVKAPEGLRLLDHLVVMGETARCAVYDRAQTDAAKAAEGALRSIPEPDAAQILMEQVERLARKAAEVCRDPTTQPRIAKLASDAASLHADLAAEHHGRLTAWRQGLSA